MPLEKIVIKTKTIRTRVCVVQPLKTKTIYGNEKVTFSKKKKKTEFGSHGDFRQKSDQKLRLKPNFVNLNM